MIYNFRFDREQTDEIIRRIKVEHLLSQGWGGGVDTELRVDHPDFIEATRGFYDLATTRIPSNLMRMREFQDGDLLVTPHLPEYGKVSIHVVKGNFPDCYQYIQKDQTHLNHTIRLHPSSFGLDGSINIRNSLLLGWCGKLPWLRLPILPLREVGELFESIVDQLRKDSTKTFEPSGLDQIIEELRESVFELCAQKLRLLESSGRERSFESFCERLVTTSGYRIARSNVSDGKGGDVDLVCTRDRSNYSPFETGELCLLVQIKKYKGVTDEHAVQQLLRMFPRYPGANAVVMSLGETFSPKAEKLAKDNGIALLNRDAICILLLAEWSQNGSW